MKARELLKIALTRGDNGRLYVEVWEAVELNDAGGGTYRQISCEPVSEDSELHTTFSGGESA